MEETTYTKKDGVRAIFLYLISCFYPVVSSVILPYSIRNDVLIETSQWVLPIIAIVICLFLVKTEKRSFRTIGFTPIKSIRPIVICIVGTIVMVGFEGLFCYVPKGKTHISSNFSNGLIALSMLTAAIEEEISGRAYMQSRLRGFIENERVVLIIASFLFMLSHYPPYLVLGDLLSMSQVVILLVLGLVCGIQYNKTHNVLIPIITHYIYNMVYFY